MFYRSFPGIMFLPQNPQVYIFLPLSRDQQPGNKVEGGNRKLYSVIVYFIWDAVIDIEKISKENTSITSIRTCNSAIHLYHFTKFNNFSRNGLMSFLASESGLCPFLRKQIVIPEGHQAQYSCLRSSILCIRFSAVGFLSEIERWHISEATVDGENVARDALHNWQLSQYNIQSYYSCPTMDNLESTLIIF